MQILMQDQITSWCDRIVAQNLEKIRYDFLKMTHSSSWKKKKKNVIVVDLITVTIQQQLLK